MELIPLAGFWDTILSPLHWAVSGVLWCAHWLLSPLFGPDSGLTWGLSIVLLTVIIRTALIPLFVRQIRSSRNLQVLQPKMRELQKKYADDREKLGQETMKLYKEEGVNPMASCFPILLQMPIFFALFNVLNNAAAGADPVAGSVLSHEMTQSLAHANFFGATLADRFWPLTDGWGITQTVAAIMIVLMVVTQFFAQYQLMSKNMPPESQTGPMAQQQKIMLYAMPLVFGIGGVNFPLGVLLYWSTSNLWSMCQQFYIIRQNPTPGTPAYVAWEERLRAKGHDPRDYKPGQKVPRKPVVKTERVSEPESNGSAKAAPVDPTKPRVQRQQPRRETRSSRKGK